MWVEYYEILVAETKADKNTEFNRIPAHDHREAGKCSNYWAVDKSQLFGTKVRLIKQNCPDNSPHTSEM